MERIGTDTLCSYPFHLFLFVSIYLDLVVQMEQMEQIEFRFRSEKPGSSGNGQNQAEFTGLEG